MPKKKSDINTSFTVPGTLRARRYNGKIVTVDYGALPVSVARREIRKLTRDPSPAGEKVENPYLSLRILNEGLVGGVCYNHASTGSVHMVQSGDLFGESWSASPKNFNGRMGYPNAGTRYVPLTGEWPVNPDLLSQAEVKCYAALRNKYAEMDLDSYLSFGLWYGERAETASLVRDVGKAFLQLITAYRNRNPAGIARTLKALRSEISYSKARQWAAREIERTRIQLQRRNRRYKTADSLALATVDFVNRSLLAWNLGASPLLKDMDRVYKALRYDTVKDPSKLMIKAKGWVQKQDVDSETVDTDRGHVKITTRVNHLVRYTCVLVARPSITDRALLERLGLGNPLSLALELTSCSFLVNYVWGILDYLKATSTPMAFEFCDGSWSKKISHLQWVDIKSSSSSGNRKAAGRWSHLEYNRKLYVKFPFPIPPLSLKGTDLNADQATNVATIIWSKVRKALGG